MNTNGT